MERAQLTRKRILRKQVTLLLNSRAIEEFTWLKTLLQQKVDEGRPYLTFEEISNFPAVQKQFFQNSLDDLERASTNEWKCETDDIQGDGGESRDDWVHCALCNAPNRYVFYIINALNGIRLNVGSTCITHFGFNTGGKSMPQLQKEAKKVRWVTEIDQSIPDVRHLVASWDDHLKTYPVLIPKSYEETFRALGSKFRVCFEKYIDPKTNHGVDDLDHTVQELKRLLEEGERLKEQMATYSKAHENDQFVVTREIVKWVHRLDTKDSQLILKLLKQDGHITAPTAHRIAEPHFMQSLVSNLNNELRNIGLQVISIDPSRPGYTLATTNKPVIQLYISHRNLLLTIGGAVFEKQQSVQRAKVVKYCKIANDESRDIVKAKLARALESLGYSEPSLSGSLESTRAEYDEWVLIEKSSQRIIIVEKLHKVLDQYFAGTITEGEFVRDYLGPRVHRYSRDEFQDKYSNRAHNSI